MWSLIAGKARPTGASAAGRPSVELPEKTARGLLAAKLAEFERSQVDLSDSHAHLSRSEVDEQSALNNLELSDEESADRVAVAERSRGIYGARVANREAAQAKLLKELKTAVKVAHNEFSTLVNDERTRRRDILFTRVTEAGRLVGSFTGELEVLLECSGLIQAIHALEIGSQSLLFCDSAEQITGIAKRILAGYEAIAAKAKEQI